MAEFDALRVQCGQGRVQAALGGLLGDHVGGNLLLRQGAAVAHGAAAVGLGLGLGQLGAGLDHGGLLCTQVGAYAVIGQAGQQLAAFDYAAHVYQHLGNAQASFFAGDAGGLPGKQATCELLGAPPVELLWLYRRDG